MRAIRSLGTAVIVLLTASTMARLLTMVASAQQMRLIQDIIDGHPVTAAQIVDSDETVGLTALIWIGATIPAVVLWLVWQHRATKNLRSASVVGPTFTPRMAVVWWFVPFASLVKPFQAIRELWCASASPRGWKPPKAPAVIGWWWAAWLTGNLIAAAANRMTNAADMPAAYRDGLWVELVGDLVLVVAASLAVMVVTGVVKLQEKLSPQTTLAAPPRPDPVY